MTPTRRRLPLSRARSRPAVSVAPGQRPVRNRRQATAEPAETHRARADGPGGIGSRRRAGACSKPCRTVRPLAKIEMPAYWRCLKWARAQSFADLERRAVKRIVYTQLWEQPDKYRGKLIRLRLHVRRILDWEAPENSAGVRRVYEAWGWTDESKSFPYVVVFSEVPEGIRLGDNLQEEGLFVGYFLKTIAYTAYNKNRSSPLLLGRMKWLGSTAPAHPIVSGSDWFWIYAVGLPLVLLIVSGTWFQMRRLRRVKLPAAPADEAEMENWFRSGSGSSPADDASHNPQTPAG